MSHSNALQADLPKRHFAGPFADGASGAVCRPKYRVRVRRATSATHQFLIFAAQDLKRVDCPKGWMSPEGYVRYLKVTLAKMRQRQARSGKTH
jgi:hypothetical protein